MATAVQQPNVSEYLSKKQEESGKDLAGDWQELEELHNKKYVALFASFRVFITRFSAGVCVDSNLQTADSSLKIVKFHCFLCYFLDYGTNLR